jgi:hypothetical protein
MGECPLASDGKEYALYLDYDANKGRITSFKLELPVETYRACIAQRAQKRLRRQ